MLPLETQFASSKPPSPLSPKIMFTTSTCSEQEVDDCPFSIAQATVALDPQRRSPPPDDRPDLRTVRSSRKEHILSVQLPGFSPEMVTISARKDDKLAVVADLWHVEANSHYEWLVTFPGRDVNVALARAQFANDGTLTIHVPRSCIDEYYTLWGGLR